LLSDQITPQGKEQGSSACYYHNYRDCSNDKGKKKKRKSTVRIFTSFPRQSRANNSNYCMWVWCKAHWKSQIPTYQC